MFRNWFTSPITSYACISDHRFTLSWTCRSQTTDAPSMRGRMKSRASPSYIKVRTGPPRRGWQANVETFSLKCGNTKAWRALIVGRLDYELPRLISLPNTRPIVMPTFQISAYQSISALAMGPGSSECAYHVVCW